VSAAAAAAAAPSRYLLVAQVVLALQLPFTLVPLIKATSSSRLMGPHKNSKLVEVTAWIASGLVFLANLMLFVTELWPGAAYIPQVIADGEQQGMNTTCHTAANTTQSTCHNQINTTQ
jgi:hypothetical protein